MKSIALLFPYFGKLPVQYKMWRESALRNPTVDFIFFTDADVIAEKNIIVYKMKFEEFRQYIQAIFDFPIVLDRPYILCDFKPTYGQALQKYICKYDFWGYGDLDVVYGDLRTFLTEEVLNRYKFFLGYGHLTLYSNDNNTNSYYKEIVPGYQDYQKALTIHEQTFFDEYDHKGTADKWKDCRQEDCFLDWQFDNITPPKKSYHMRSLTRGWDQVLFEHKDSKLYMLRFNYGKIEKKEAIYAHFQHRSFMKDHVTNYNHFLITPRAMIDYPKHFVKIRLQWLSRKRPLMTKYYQWKDRILWKIGLGFIR